MLMLVYISMSELFIAGANVESPSQSLYELMLWYDVMQISLTYLDAISVPL